MQPSPYVQRDWLVAATKASNAIVEAIAAEKLQSWYLRQGKRVHVNWNLATDIARKQQFDLVDTLGVTWEVKNDRIAVDSGRVFIEESWSAKSKADMALIFAAGFAHILTRSQLLAVPAIGEAQGGDFNLARGHYISLDTLRQASNIL